MKVASVSVLLGVFHISSLNAGKLYYPYPTIKDDVQVRPQYIPASNTFPAYDTSAYPTWEYLQWAPAESIPWSIDDGSAYYHYPNHKHIGSSIPCPKKGHTTRKPYITPEVTTTTTTTTPRPTPHVVHALKVDHHKANAKGSVVGITTTFKELELMLSQLKLALSKFARTGSFGNDIGDDTRSLPVSSETNEDSELGEKEEVIEQQSKPEMQIGDDTRSISVSSETNEDSKLGEKKEVIEQPSKPEMQNTPDVAQEEAIVQAEDNSRTDNNEEFGDVHPVEDVTDQIIDNSSPREEVTADQQEKEIRLRPEHREEVNHQNVLPWFNGLNQDQLLDLPADDRQQEATTDQQETGIHLLPEGLEEVNPENVLSWFNGLNQDLLRDLPSADRYQVVNADNQETRFHLLPEPREEASFENVLAWFNGLNQDLFSDLPLAERYF